jgi:hypothetical protein
MYTKAFTRTPMKMAISTQWRDPRHSLLIWTFSKPWTARDFEHAIAQSQAGLPPDEPFDVIFDFQAGPEPPSGFLQCLHRCKFAHRLPARYLLVAHASPLLSEMLNMARNIPFGITQEMSFFSTVVDAIRYHSSRTTPGTIPPGLAFDSTTGFF